jgi:hypothetical protein
VLNEKNVVVPEVYAVDDRKGSFLIVDVIGSGITTAREV